MRQPVVGQEPLTIEVTTRRLALASMTTAVVLGSVLLALVIVKLTRNELDHQLTISDIRPGEATILAYARVGVVVARHQRRNPLGWILILFTLLTMLAVDAGSYAVFCYRRGHPGCRWPRRPWCWYRCSHRTQAMTGTERREDRSTHRPCRA